MEQHTQESIWFYTLNGVDSDLFAREIFVMKKIISVILVVILLAIIVFAVNIFATAQTPQDNITVTFDEKTGTLTVSGTGKVSDLYRRNVEADFLSWADNNTIKEIDTTVKHLIIEDGITQIYNSFNDLHALEDVTFPKTLQKIDTSFINCDAIAEVKFPKSLKQICRTSFYDCDSITRIKFSAPVVLANDEKVESNVFGNLDALEFVEIPRNSTLADVFVNCENLKTVILGSNIKTETGIHSALDGEAGPYFFGCNEKLTVYMFSKDNSYRLDHVKTFVYGIWVIVAAVLLVTVIVLLMIRKKRKKS